MMFGGHTKNCIVGVQNRFWVVKLSVLIPALKSLPIVLWDLLVRGVFK
jgi:hypothetical protein